MAIPHAYGRLQFGADLDLHFRTLIGVGANPNVAGVVVIGIEDQWTGRIVEGIAHRASRSTASGSSSTAIATRSAGLDAANAYLQWASEKHASRRPEGALGLDQVRRERHDVGLRLLPHRRQRVRQALGERQHAGVRRDDRADRRRASGEGALPQRPRSRTAFQAVFDRYQAVVRRTRPPTSPRASRPRATSRAA